MPYIEYRYLGGFCPVQGEGRINGYPFYFRSRGNHWSLHINMNKDADEAIFSLGDPGYWNYGEEYGEWPEAGWITIEQAQEFILKAAKKFESEVFTE